MMGARKLAVTTIVPANGRDDVADGHLILGPEDEVPVWAAEHIGDHCWADDSPTVSDAADDGKPGRGRPASKPE